MSSGWHSSVYKAPVCRRDFLAFQFIYSTSVDGAAPTCTAPCWRLPLKEPTCLGGHSFWGSIQRNSFSALVLFRWGVLSKWGDTNGRGRRWLTSWRTLRHLGFSECGNETRPWTEYRPWNQCPKAHKWRGKQDTGGLKSESCLGEPCSLGHVT